MTRKYRKRGGQGPNSRRSTDPPEIFSMDRGVMDRDIESQIPNPKEEMRYSDSGDLIPPPPPLYRKVSEKTNPKPKPEEPELYDIDKPFGEKTFVARQSSTSIKPIEYDVENPLQNNSEFSGLGPDSEWGIFDDRFNGGKRRKTRKRSKRSYKKRHIKKRKSNRKR